MNTETGLPKRHTVLVIDDEAQIVKSIINALRLDYRVLGTTSAAEAIEILRREQVNVVMSDQRMPEMTGVELLQRIGREQPDAIRLLFTGYADISAVIDAINKGSVYRYITKPWDPDELQTVIRDACAHYDLLAERRELLNTLQMKNAELKRSNELKSAFIQVAGHEFRTPVTILVGLCKLALRDPELSESVQDHLARIDGASARLERLVRQILAMLAAERFDRMLDLELADVAKLLNQAADDIRPFVALRRQSLEMNLADDLGSLHLDAEKMRDSLNHLLLNAVKFTPDNGKIDLKARREAGGMIISVSDTGCGIAPECMPRMFEPFFTSLNVSTHSSGHYEYGARGLGLGLSLVKAFTEMHGGQVAVESELGKGSTFSIFLPGGVEAKSATSPPAPEAVEVGA
jgi:signal transduction histidine kinase